MLGDATDSLVKQYCMYPDWHRSGLPDGQKEKVALHKPYVQLPLLKDLRACHKCDDDSEICFYIVAPLMHNAVKHLRLGNLSEAAKYMGPVLHFIADNACPVRARAATPAATLIADVIHTVCIIARDGEYTLCGQNVLKMNPSHLIKSARQ